MFPSLDVFLRSLLKRNSHVKSVQWTVQGVQFVRSNCSNLSVVISNDGNPPPDIRSAEAAKVIENNQRDLNIALVNECSLIYLPDGSCHHRGP